MVNKYFINELGVEATYLELRIFSYLECEEKIIKITEILNFLNNHNFITNLTMLYHSMMRAENMVEHQGVPSLTIDLRDDKFRFKYWDGAKIYWTYHLNDLFECLIEGRKDFTTLMDTYKDLNALFFNFQKKYKDDILSIRYEFYPVGYNVDILYELQLSSKVKENNTTNLVLKRIYDEINNLENVNSLSFEIDYSFKEKCTACEKAKERMNEYKRNNTE